MAKGAGPGTSVFFGDIDGDGKDDYLLLDGDTGGLKCWFNGGADTSRPNGWIWDGSVQVARGVPRTNPQNFLIADV